MQPLGTSLAEGKGQGCPAPFYLRDTRVLAGAMETLAWATLLFRTLIFKLKIALGPLGGVGSRMRLMAYAPPTGCSGTWKVAF